jgi:hypothetical protein
MSTELWWADNCEGKTEVHGQKLSQRCLIHNVLPFLYITNPIFHTDTAAFQLTLQGTADDESLKFLMSGSFFYIWLLAFCWAGDNLTEQVLTVLTEPL